MSIAVGEHGARPADFSVVWGIRRELGLIHAPPYVVRKRAEVAFAAETLNTQLGGAWA